MSECPWSMVVQVSSTVGRRAGAPCIVLDLAPGADAVPARHASRRRLATYDMPVASVLVASQEYLLTALGSGPNRPVRVRLLDGNPLRGTRPPSMIRR
jgi:hypothetical protein